MSTYTQLHVHIVIAVKYRLAVIGPTWRDEMLRYQTGLIQKKWHKLIAINAMSDHLHILIGRRPVEGESDLMRDLKSDTSEWINKRRLSDQHFAWQDGYGAFNLHKELVPVVARYIRNQEEHHRKKTFRTEILDLLHEYDIPYDERYLWHEPV